MQCNLHVKFTHLLLFFCEHRRFVYFDALRLDVITTSVLLSCLEISLNSRTMENILRAHDHDACLVDVFSYFIELNWKIGSILCSSAIFNCSRNYIHRYFICSLHTIIYIPLFHFQCHTTNHFDSLAKWQSQHTACCNDCDVVFFLKPIHFTHNWIIQTESMALSIPFLDDMTRHKFKFSSNQLWTNELKTTSINMEFIIGWTKFLF